MNDYTNKFKVARDLRLSKQKSSTDAIDSKADEKWETLVQLNIKVKKILTTIGVIEWGRHLWSPNYKILFPAVLSCSPDASALRKLNQCVWILEHSIKKHDSKRRHFSTYEQYTLTIKFNDDGQAANATVEGKSVFETDNISTNGLTDIFAKVIETGPDIDTHYSY